MKVSELIKLLEKVNPDAEVVYFDDFGEKNQLTAYDFTELKHRDWKRDTYPAGDHDMTAEFFGIPQFSDAHYIDNGEW